MMPTVQIAPAIDDVLQAVVKTIGMKHGPEWVSVSVVRYPLSEAPLPANLAKSQDSFNRSGYPGHFAPLAVASVDDPFDPMAATKGNVVPLYRGHGMHVRFEGLESIVSLRQ
jgi:hypothetical protein